MVWTNEIVRMVRFLVNDLDADSYSDERLEETILVAAQLLCNNIDFDHDYIIDVDTLTLNIDPTTTSPKDNFFINILAVKAACIVLGSEAKTLAAQSFRIKDASSSIDVSAAYSSIKQLHQEMCDRLEKMIIDHKAGNSIAGQAVLGPYTQESLSGGYFIRNYY